MNRVVEFVTFFAIVMATTVGNVSAIRASENLQPLPQIIPTGDEEIPSFQEWRLQAARRNIQGVKDCQDHCKRVMIRCKRKCDINDIHCMAKCEKGRANCYKVCKGDKPPPRK